MKRLILLVVATPLIVSCSSTNIAVQPSPFDKAVPAYYVPIKTNRPDLPRAEEFQRFVQQTLGFMHEPVARAIPQVTISDDVEYFKQAPGETGHCHTDNGNICFYVHRLYRGGIFHEAFHSYDMWDGKRGRNIHASWTKIAGDVYGKGRYAPDAAFPQAGLLTLYSEIDESEDRAEWGKAIYCYLGGLASPLKNKFDKSDPRYLQKLQWLRNHNRISEEMYAKILPLIEDK